MRKFYEVKVAVVCTHKGLKGMKYTVCNKWKKWNNQNEITKHKIKEKIKLSVINKMKSMVHK